MVSTDEREKMSKLEIHEVICNPATAKAPFDRILTKKDTFSADFWLVFIYLAIVWPLSSFSVGQNHR